MPDHDCHKEDAINRICVSVFAMEKALLGDINTRQPGLIEENRETMSYVRELKDSKFMEEHREMLVFIRERKETMKSVKRAGWSIAGRWIERAIVAGVLVWLGWFKKTQQGG